MGPLARGGKFEPSSGGTLKRPPLLEPPTQIEGHFQNGGWECTVHAETHLFSRARKKGFSFFSCGATPCRTVPKTQPLQVAISLRERVDLRPQKEGIWGKKIAWGRVGRKGKKKEKRMHKKRWGSNYF